VSLESGYDFLGFNIRRYRNGKLLIKPSNAAWPRSSTSLSCAVAHSRSVTEFRPLAVCCACREQAVRLDHRPVGRQVPGPPPCPAAAHARRSGRLIMGASSSDWTVPSV